MSVSRIYRLLKLITMLQQRRSYTAAELAQELEISRRTVFRDLNMLEMAQIPYYFDPDNGGYRIAQDFFLPPINLTITEALAMLALTGRARGANMPLLAEGTKAAMKVEGALPSSIRSHVGSILEHLTVRLGPLAGHVDLEGVFEQLIQAIPQRRVCRLVYLSFQEQKQIITLICPLRLVFLGRAWYVIAYSRSHKAVRTFKLSRIRKLTLQKDTFAPLDDVDVDRHFGNAWCMIPEGTEYDIHLRFAPKVAGNVAEVRWHPSQRTVWNDDGSLDYHVRVDGLGEISWWILGYGDQVEVLAPPPLREQIAHMGQSIAARYSQEGA